MSDKKQYNFNPQTNLPRRDRLNNMIRNGIMTKQQIPIGDVEADEFKQDPRCKYAHDGYHQCLRQTQFDVEMCADSFKEISRCEQEKGIVAEKRLRAIKILELSGVK